MDDVILRKIQENYHPAFTFRDEQQEILMSTCKKCGCAVLEQGARQHYIWHITREGIVDATGSAH